MYENINTGSGAAIKTDGFYQSGSVEAMASPAKGVMAEYGYLREELSYLSETVDSLRLKLEPVIGPSHPTDAAESGSKPPQQQLSPLGETLRSDTAQTRQIRCRLQDLIDRIEL